MANNKKSSEAQVVEEEEATQVVEVTVVEEQADDNESTTQVVKEEKSSTTKSETEEEAKPEALEAEGDDDESDEDNEFTNALKKVRNEAKNLRKRLRDAEQTIEELRAQSNDAVVEERNGLLKQLNDLKLEVRTDKTRGSVVEAARKANAIEPDAVAEMVMSKVEYDAEDKPTNIDKVIADYKATYKKLFTGAVGNGNIGNRNERGSKYEGMSNTDLIANALKNDND